MHFLGLSTHLVTLSNSRVRYSLFLRFYDLKWEISDDESLSLKTFVRLSFTQAPDFLVDPYLINTLVRTHHKLLITVRGDSDPSSSESFNAAESLVLRLISRSGDEVRLGELKMKDLQPYVNSFL